MWTKEEYYALVLQNREIAGNPNHLKCTCTQTLCEWHGRCRECAALHRYHRDHVPACFQDFINDKLRDLVKIGELSVAEKGKTPLEYRQYVKEQDQAALFRPKEEGDD